MQFKLPEYRKPDFSAEVFVNAPDASIAQSPMDAIAPDNFHATSIYPEYFKVDGDWKLAENSRMGHASSVTVTLPARCPQTT